MHSLALLLSLAASASAVGTVMRFACDGHVELGEKTLIGPISLKWNGAAQLIKVSCQGREKSFFS
jgi:hypothetical protein